jgi:NADPH-dependent glutamate synthase beta subunit-like oxidoreductase
MFTTCEQCGVCSSACPITGVDGFNIRRIIRYVELGLIDEIASSPYPWACTTCGRCEDACPNGIAILDVVRTLRSMAPEAYVPETIPPCIRACPAGIDVPGYLRRVAEGKAEEACAVILEKVPFPGILGRACPHPCEDVCRRGEVNEPIAICALKRYAADASHRLSQTGLAINPDTGRKVAVIGAGPAGLTAAFYLRKKGHHVTIFEERSEAGGMMRYAVPYYRIPAAVLEKEIGRILGMGIALKSGRQLGRDFDLSRLRKDGYDAVFLAMGLQKSREIDIEGIDLNGVFWGLDFLRNVKEGKAPTLKERVLVVGGGGVAVDVALTALRSGAGNVTLACLESEDEMPATPEEIELALEEGVTVMNGWGPKRIIGQTGKVVAVELTRCASVFDDQGNFCPVFEDVIKKVEADRVIMAVGQSADLSGLENMSLEKGNIIVDGMTRQTDIEGVFAGGDMTGEGGTIIDAIAAGRRAAVAIDQYLGGVGIIDEAIAGRSPSSAYTGKREKAFADQKRQACSNIPLKERRHGFLEVERGLTKDQAKKEAMRCLQCDLEWKLGRNEGTSNTPS